jgi:hypothetical protein
MYDASGGACGVQLTRTSFQPLEAVHRPPWRSPTASWMCGGIRPSLLALGAVALVGGAMISPARSQSSSATGGVQPPAGVGERLMITTEPVVGGDLPPSPSDPMPLAPWRDWPRVPGNAVYDGWTTDGIPFSGSDGRMCWPHGDHFHCR